jgi:secondary thiamine-phosphate synthase enzyme
METIPVKTSKKEQIIDITSEVKDIVSQLKVKQGICVLYCPHTSAGIMINENADPEVKHDLLLSFDTIVKDPGFKHEEGNSKAHVVSSMIGKSQTLIIHESKLVLGNWDGIMFAEFDGPRDRKVLVEIIHKA